MAYNKETKMWEGYIYKITNKINNHIYIGQTRQTIYARFSRHKSDAKNKPTITLLYIAFNKYGINNFLIEELEYYSYSDIEKLKEKLNEREIFLIQKYKDEGNILYNMTIGGDNAGNTYPEVSVIQYDLFCNEIDRYKSIVEASEKTNTQRSDIITCCQKKTNIYSANNYIWRYENDPLSENEISELKKRYKGCKQYDFSGNLLNVFFTIHDAVLYLQAQNINALSSNISSCCNGKIQSSVGFVWRYYYDDFDKYVTPNTYKKVEQRDVYTGELIRTFNSYIEAGNVLKMNKSLIYLCCENHNNTCSGYIWCYEGEFDFHSLKKQHTKPVRRYGLDHKYIDTWDSIKSASNALNINASSIGDVCRNVKKTAGKFIWRYAYDDISTYKYN